MRRYRLSRAAENDLDELWRYVADRNVDAANSLIGRITSKFKILARFPEAGRRREDIGKGLRMLPVGNYLIIYRTDQNVQIVRVVQRRQKHFGYDLLGGETAVYKSSSRVGFMAPPLPYAGYTFIRPPAAGAAG